MLIARPLHAYVGLRLSRKKVNARNTDLIKKRYLRVRAPLDLDADKGKCPAMPRRELQVALRLASWETSEARWMNKS
jgi:hypothetical protein